MNRKYILTIEIPAGQNGDGVERMLRRVADATRGRLTRSDYTPSDVPGYVTQTGHKTLRKLGASDREGGR